MGKFIYENYNDFLKFLANRDGILTISYKNQGIIAKKVFGSDVALARYCNGKTMATIVPVSEVETAIRTLVFFDMHNAVVFYHYNEDSLDLLQANAYIAFLDRLNRFIEEKMKNKIDGPAEWLMSSEILQCCYRPSDTIMTKYRERMYMLRLSEAVIHATIIGELDIMSKIYLHTRLDYWLGKHKNFLKRIENLGDYSIYRYLNYLSISELVMLSTNINHSKDINGMAMVELADRLLKYNWPTESMDLFIQNEKLIMNNATRKIT